MLIDSHCHPDDERFDGELAGLCERAAAAGVGGLVAIGGGDVAAELDVALRVAEQARTGGGPAPRIWATAGVHPHEAAGADEESWSELSRLARETPIIAIGEIGLDYFYDHSPREQQRQALVRQLEIARAAGLPVSIHCRDAFEDCVAALEGSPPVGVVFHCFTGSAQWAERVLENGWYLSFSGMLTFPKSHELRAVAAGAPADRILVETDAPFLAPVPHRGRRNEPAFVVETAKVLAGLRGWTLAETEQHTAENFFRLFPRARD